MKNCKYYCVALLCIIFTLVSCSASRQIKGHIEPEHDPGARLYPLKIALVVDDELKKSEYSNTRGNINISLYPGNVDILAGFLKQNFEHLDIIDEYQKLKLANYDLLIYSGTTVTKVDKGKFSVTVNVEIKESANRKSVFSCGDEQYFHIDSKNTELWQWQL